MAKALFIGEINVDIQMGGLAHLPKRDTEICCKTYEVTMGSSAVITACAYSNLGGCAALLGLAGKDSYGEFMVKGLQSHGVDTSRVQYSRSVQTGVTVNLIHNTTRTQITYPGSIAEFDGRAVQEKTFHGFDHVHFAAPYLQPKLRPRLAQLMRMARKRGLTVSLDPQWDNAERWRGMSQWLPLLDCLFVNAQEACSITRRATPEEACLALSERVAQVVVKCGPRGALTAVDGSLIRAKAPRIKLVDTTGAGDCLDGGFLYARLQRKMSVQDALRFAVATASRKCLFVGGTSARSSYRDIQRLMKDQR